MRDGGRRHTWREKERDFFSSKAVKLRNHIHCSQNRLEDCNICKAAIYSNHREKLENKVCVAVYKVLHQSL